MPTVRVYLAVTAEDLDDLSRSGSLTNAADRVAFAVTPALRDSLSRARPEPDEDELEFAAFSSTVNLGDSRDGARTGDRRLVIAAADLDTAQLTERPGGELGEVSVAAPVPLRRVASLHVEDVGVRDGSGTPDPLEFLWYDVTELSMVRELLG